MFCGLPAAVPTASPPPRADTVIIGVSVTGDDVNATTLTPLSVEMAEEFASMDETAMLISAPLSKTALVLIPPVMPAEGETVTVACKIETVRTSVVLARAPVVVLGR
jgi:hypothetical protein